MFKKANKFPCFFRLSGQDGFINSINNNSNLLYWSLHYHNLYNVCIVSHICIPNEEVGGARNVYLNKFNISI